MKTNCKDCGHFKDNHRHGETTDDFEKIGHCMHTNCDCEQYEPEIDMTQQTHLQKAKELAAKNYPCWNTACDNDQTITDAELDEDGDWQPVPVQCQYCWSREEIVTSTYLQAERDILDLMSKHTPASEQKKTVAYNEGVTSGWYAAKEFIRQSLKQTKD